MPTFPILLLFAIAVAITAALIFGPRAVRPVPQRARQPGRRSVRRRPF
jgi:hypothetical protein